MKTNKLLIGVVLLLGACSQDRMDIPQMPESAEPVSVNVKAIENYLSKTRRGLTRGDNYTLTPWIVNGDTTMFIVNFPEGGFEIFSNCQALPMVLAKSKEGSFYPNVLVNPSPFFDYMEKYTVMGSYLSHYISMNWGWYGQYNEVLIDADLTGWEIERANDTLFFNKNSIVTYTI